MGISGRCVRKKPAAEKKLTASSLPSCASHLTSEVMGSEGGPSTRREESEVFNFRLSVSVIGLVAFALIATGVGLFDYRAGLIAGGCLLYYLAHDLGRPLDSAPSSKRRFR